MKVYDRKPGQRPWGLQWARDYTNIDHSPVYHHGTGVGGKRKQAIYSTEKGQKCNDGGIKPTFSTRRGAGNNR